MNLFHLIEPESCGKNISNSFYDSIRLIERIGNKFYKLKVLKNTI